MSYELDLTMAYTYIYVGDSIEFGPGKKTDSNKQENLCASIKLLYQK